MLNHSRRGFLRGWRPHVAYCLLVLASSAFASPFDCTDSGHCGLRGDGSYPHLVVGTVEHVADDTEATRIFRWARDHGYWASLPNDAAAFLQEIKIVSIAVLCRAEDPACPAQYRAGIYRVEDGAPLDPDTQAEVADGIKVDPVTYRPVARTEKAENQ